MTGSAMSDIRKTQKIIPIPDGVSGRCRCTWLEAGTGSRTIAYEIIVPRMIFVCISGYWLMKKIL
jgi:hypothetical protein